MQASEYFAYIQAREQSTTVATRQATKSDIAKAKPDAGIDWHADRRTEQE